MSLRRERRIALVLVALVIGGGCGRTGATPWPGPEGGDRELPRNRPTTADGRLASKVVNAKEPPTTLVAIDRTTCLVTAEKFRETVIGSRVWCMWR